MKRVLFPITSIAVAVLVIAIGGVDNIARGQSSLPAPDNVSADNGMNLGEASVSWGAVTGATFYRIGWMADEDYERALQEPNGEWLKEFRYSNIMNRGQTSHTVTRLTPGIKYWIIVGSHDAFYGAPQWSGWQEVTLEGATDLPPPDRVDAVDLDTVAFDGSRLSSISAGENHTCGVRQDGTVHCFGDDGLGQSSPPEGEFLSVSAGGRHTCGIKADASVVCWGSAAVETPTSNQKFAQIASGDHHVCGLTPRTESGSADIICWGAPGQGRTDDLSEVREPRDNIWNIEQIAVGSNHNCMITNYRHGTGHDFYRSVRCWGSNESGQLSGTTGAAQISAGGSHTCWIATNGTAGCRGSDVSGQRTVPVPSEGAFDQSAFTYTQISAGGNHTCAINSDGNSAQPTGTVSCWGSNRQGQTSAPTDEFDSVSSGKSHNCALRHDGTISCWGDNSYGQAPR